MNDNNLRFTFTNPFTPTTNYLLNTENKQIIIDTKDLNLINVNKKLYYDYNLEVILCPAEDGEAIPCTIFYKKGKVKKDRKNKLLVLGYGAYGLNNDLSFDPTLLAAVERGWIIAYAHIRGGYEMGDYWHGMGKLRNKKNSINDYIAVILNLIQLGYSHPNFIAGYGASAGASVVAQSMNKHPSLFRACILNHPFLDVLSTLLNGELRLSETDYEEFGNPIQNENDYFNIMGWSPYENLSVQEYPAVFITMSLEDSRVPSFGTLKYIEKLRLKANSPVRLPDFISGYKNICVQIEDSGHNGPKLYDLALKNKINELAWIDKMMVENIDFTK